MLTPKPIACSELTIHSQITVYHTGPSLDRGPMPAIFYFALSGEDSLCLDPFNQPVQFLTNYPIRIFSMTLPGHESGLPPENALNVWAEDMKKNRSPLSDFIQQADTAINYLIDQELIKDQIAVMGLSRGCLISSMLAAQNKHIRFMLLFAPLMILANAKEFKDMQDHPAVQSANAFNVTDKIYDRHTRIYIGNRDLRVSTKSSFEFTQAIVEQAFKHNIRSPSIEMIMSPSIGHLGHGTPPHIFKNGIDWLTECLLRH